MTDGKEHGASESHSGVTGLVVGSEADAHFSSRFLKSTRNSVAEVQFSPVLPPFFENREPN